MARAVAVNPVPMNAMIFDIGPETVARIGEAQHVVAADKAGPRFLDWLAGSHLMA